MLRGQRPVSSAEVNALASAEPPAKPPVLVVAPAKPAAAALFSAGWDDDPAADSAPAPELEPDLDALLRMRGTLVRG